MKKEIFCDDGGMWYEDERCNNIIPNGTYKIYSDGSSKCCQIIEFSPFIGFFDEEYYDFTEFHNNLIKLGVTPLAERLMADHYDIGFSQTSIELTDEELKLLKNTDYVNYINDKYLLLHKINIIKPCEYFYAKEYIATVEDGYICINDKNHFLIQNDLSDTHVYYDTDGVVTDNIFMKDFIYKVDDSNKITAQTGYDSIDEFISEPITNDLNLDTLVICTADTKLPLIKLEKIEKENKLNYRFIVDITIDNGNNFSIKATIETQEQLNQKLEQTIEALKQYPEFSKYADDLEDCL